LQALPRLLKKKKKTKSKNNRIFKEQKEPRRNCTLFHDCSCGRARI